MDKLALRDGATQNDSPGVPRTNVARLPYPAGHFEPCAS